MNRHRRWRCAAAAFGGSRSSRIRVRDPEIFFAFAFALPLMQLYSEMDVQLIRNLHVECITWMLLYGLVEAMTGVVITCLKMTDS